MALEMDDETFCKTLPKTELHAHLSGSISPSLLHEFWLERLQKDPSFDMKDPEVTLEAARKGMDLESFFPLFGNIIYRLCDSKQAVERYTVSVIHDFEADGVKYLELRTMPRPTKDLTKEEYVQTVLKVLEAHSNTDFRVHLILSVDRKNTPEEALEVIDLAIKYKDYRIKDKDVIGVVGVDLAGNPAKGDVKHFKDAYQRARDAGLKVTLHFAEAESSSTDEELRALLDYIPDRLGHVIEVPEWAKKIIQERKLGLELCLTSNVEGKMISGGFAGHHFGYWKDKGCPIAICTDDVGIFRSPTSNEYAMLMQHFGLTRSEIIGVSRSATPCIFGTDKDKEEFVEKLEAFESQQLKADK